MRTARIWYREQSDMIHIRGFLARRVAMPTPFAPHIILSHNARTELQALVRAYSTPQSLGLRARIVLRAADTDTPTNLQIGRDLGCCNHTVGKCDGATSPWAYQACKMPCAQGVHERSLPLLVYRSSRWPASCHKTRIAPSPAGPLMRSWRLCLTLCTPIPSAAQVSGVSFQTLISSRTRVSTG